jgi:hypothetical protein
LRRRLAAAPKAAKSVLDRAPAPDAGRQRWLEPGLIDKMLTRDEFAEAGDCTAAWALRLGDVRGKATARAH